jgi:hypothetical protein
MAAPAAARFAPVIVAVHGNENDTVGVIASP